MGKVKCGGSPRLSCKRDQIKNERLYGQVVYPAKRVTSPTLGPPPPCKQALTHFVHSRRKRNLSIIRQTQTDS